MIEHLQEDTVCGRGFFGGQRRSLGAVELQDRKSAEQAITKVIDRRISEDALQIALRECR